MGLFPTVRQFVEQLCFGFTDTLPAPPVATPPSPEFEEEAIGPMTNEEPDDEALPRGHAPDLEDECRQMLLNLGMEQPTALLKVLWNPRLRSTAGYAKYPSWCIELNPRLIAFDGQVARTLRHELAHLVAYHRAGRRRIEPHGAEWRQACADLGIPGEPAHHRLPLPRSQHQRRHAYQCPVCASIVHRVRAFHRSTACLACCRKYAGGHFDERFKFVKIPSERSPVA
jgi:predicted SprT family Zn-dependent metalloprotease